ncbi:hypothetical protein CN09_33795 [Rhizobium rhizogenes]|uniref:Uncharacterized protein n=1 Tax=Agrobacterium tumefaciens TaxID=358 RepID=K7XK72_AGRTU|nr:Hypothetical protein [Agrobacterium radiobacter]KEA03069.1 hypothetical protein CN09_33795 [Rhizobium rhizogenes]
MGEPISCRRLPSDGAKLGEPLVLEAAIQFPGTIGRSEQLSMFPYGTKKAGTWLDAWFRLLT